MGGEEDWVLKRGVAGRGVAWGGTAFLHFFFGGGGLDVRWALSLGRMGVICMVVCLYLFS